MSKESTLLLSTPALAGTITTDKQKGAGYHRIADNLHTFVFSFANWSGNIAVQATLALYPGDNDWFDIIIVGDGSTDFDDLYTDSSIGNFVWIRAVCQSDSGEITQIRYNY